MLKNRANNNHKFKKIIVTVDGSFHGNIAARYSFIFAEAWGSRLFVITVLAKKMGKKEEEDASLSVEKILEEAREANLDAEGVLLAGDVVGAINKFVEENSIDLVMSSTRRPHRESRLFARSITSTLMSKLPCSVIGFKITHPGRSIKPRKILVPVIGDGYKDMERADIIESFTRKFGSEITVFNVNELSSFHTKRLDKPDKDRLILSGEKKIKSFVDELKRRRINITEKIIIGKCAREEIISEASHHRYDLIILGTTMRNIIKRVVSGNPVEEILRDTPCDVMLIHFK